MPDAEHIGELAELYALGDLSEIERTRVQRHLRACDECTRRVGDAEAAVLRLVEAGEPAAPPVPARALALSPQPASRSWIAAVAAAFLAGLIPWGVTLVRERDAAAGARTAQDAASAMLAGHFAHAPFRPGAPDAPAGKVIYALRGGWIYAIVAPGPDPLDVSVVRGATHLTVARLAAGTATRSAFVPIAGRIDAIELLDRGRAVAVARISR